MPRLQLCSMGSGGIGCESSNHQLSRLSLYLCRDKDVNIREVVFFVSLLLLSFPVIRFTARLFAYIITTRASGLLYRGNRCVLATVPFSTC